MERAKETVISLKLTVLNLKAKAERALTTKVSAETYRKVTKQSVRQRK